jgi:hypothetical protein
LKKHCQVEKKVGLVDNVDLSKGSGATGVGEAEQLEMGERSNWIWGSGATGIGERSDWIRRSGAIG